MSTWTEQQKLTAADAAAGDNFGHSVSVSSPRLVIGAHKDDGGGTNRGSAYAYVWDGATWGGESNLVASDPTDNDWFGWSVAIDGDTIVVGSPLSGDGAAYIYVWNGSTWIEQQKITAPVAIGAWFGWSVSISGDRIVVGAYADENGGVVTGAAYVFTRSGGVWTEQQKLTAADGALNDFFGAAVTIEGTTIVVGAYGDDGITTNEGSAYVYVWNDPTWDQQQKLVASDASAGDRLGISVSIYGDYIVAGADDDGGVDGGSAYVYVWNDPTWDQQQKLVAADADAGDRFGVSVSISGNSIIVGARWDDDGGSNSGLAYMYSLSGAVWSQLQKLIASDTVAGDQFGVFVSIDGGVTVAGAWADDDAGSGSGSAYVFSFPTAEVHTEYRADAKLDLATRMAALNLAVSTFDVSAHVVGTDVIRGDGGETVVYFIEKP